MDMVTDPRLQQFPFDNNAFAFPSHTASSGAGSHYDDTIAYNIPNPRREHEQGWNENNSVPHNINHAQTATATGHDNAQTRLRNVRFNQQSILNGGTRPSQASSPQPLPNQNQNQNQNQNGIVFKNSSSNYPHGAAVSSNNDPLDDNNTNIYMPLSQTASNSVNYFSTDPPAQPPTPALAPQLPSKSHSDNPSNNPAGPLCNPFSPSFPLITDPPHLDHWRSRLFNITQPIHLTEEQFLTYFPHLDNVYSHRSTQKYKRKPFVSHYWDCRLKGRPSGTKKSDDPNKKKRKREKRERDLCDVKIKITEWFGEDQCRELGLEMELPPGLGLDGGAGGAVGGGVAGGGGGGGGRSGNIANGGAAGGNGQDGSNDISGSNRALQIVMEGQHRGSGTGAGTGSGTGPGINDTTERNSGATHGKIYGSIDPSIGTSLSTATGTGNRGNNASSRFPPGHPGADGKRWYTLQRVNGSAHSNAATGMVEDAAAAAAAVADATAPTAAAADIDGSGALGKDLDHKHTLEESDRIKKNSVQRYLLKEEKERRASKKKSDNPTTPASGSSPGSFWRATGPAQATIASHLSPVPTHLTFFGNSFCPFAQRIWIMLEIKSIPYQHVEVLVPSPGSTQTVLPAALLEVNPDGALPCLRHGNWAVWESSVMMEYLEELDSGVPLLPQGRGSAQIRAHCRLWVDHVERKVLPAFYAVLLMPPETAGEEATQSENRQVLMNTLQAAITKLVNASHAVGPFFLGDVISYVDVVFAPWIIRLSRVLERYRGWKRPEVGTRWQAWVHAVESDERVQRTVSKDDSYHSVYAGVGIEGWDSGDWAQNKKKSMIEMAYARMVIRREGFGLGGDLYGRLGVDPEQ